MTSTDIYRPAAIQQLETLAKNINVEFFPSQSTQDPVTIAQAAIQLAKNKLIDVIIIDIATLHIDNEMMKLSAYMLPFNLLKPYSLSIA